MAQLPDKSNNQNFEEAHQKWDIDRLVNDIEVKASEKLTPALKRNLKAIILVLSPKEAAEEIGIAASSLKPAFSVIYRLIETLTAQKANTVTYKNAHLLLGLAGYRKQEISLLPPNTLSNRIGRDHTPNPTNQIAAKKLQEIIPELKYLFEKVSLPEDLVSGVADQLQSINEAKTSYCTLAHYLDHYVQEINDCQNSQNKTFLIEQAKQALKFSLICSDRVLLPAVSYVQSQMTRSVLKEYELAFQIGLIELLGDGMTWGSFCEERLREYHFISPEYKTYQKLAKSSVLSSIFSSIEGSTTKFIESNWAQRWNEHQDTFKIFRARDHLHLQERFEEKVFKISYDRGEDAFIPRNVAEQIFSKSGLLEESLLTDDICAIFFEYFLQNPNVVFLSQIPGFKLGEPRNASRRVSFNKLVRLLAEKSNVSMSELWNINWEEGIVRYGVVGKQCIQELLHNT